MRQKGVTGRSDLNGTPASTLTLDLRCPKNLLSFLTYSNGNLELPEFSSNSNVNNPVSNEPTINLPSHTSTISLPFNMIIQSIVIVNGGSIHPAIVVSPTYVAACQT